MVKTKVFVGNLSFKTQDSDLVREFERAGKVAGANIISRGNRSLGYGFVEMESEEDANKAVQMLSKSRIDDREINVEVAKAREEGANNAQRPPRPPRRPRPAGDNNNANGSSSPGAEGDQGENTARRRRPNNRGGRTGAPRKPRVNADGTPVEGGQGQQGGQQQGDRPPRQRRERPPRQPRAEGERAPRIAAPNTLFVANLPFSVDDNGLAEIFAGLNLKAAHVVRKRNDRSKGFGFVEFNNEEDQKKALAAVDKKNVDSRELIVKIALTEANKEAAAAAGEQKDPNAAVKSASNAPGSPKPNQQ